MNDLGVKRGTVRLVEYNPDWKILFEEEKELLLQKFPNVIQKISHGGSTAIPGIKAKPIIDMFAVVKLLSDAEELKDELEVLGYEYQGERSVPGRILFVKGDNESRTHHLQLVEESHEQWKNHIVLREYYLRHSEVVKEYIALKEKLAEQFPEDRKSYTSGKDLFVKAVLRKAREEEYNLSNNS